MIEIIVYDFLKEQLSVPVYLEVPENPDPSYVIVEKTGSGVNNHIYNATIALQSYATSMYEAAALNHSVKMVMEDLIQLPQVSKSQLNSDYNFTDTEEKRYRYQAVFDIYYYETRGE